MTCRLGTSINGCFGKKGSFLQVSTPSEIKQRENDGTVSLPAEKAHMHAQMQLRHTLKQVGVHRQTVLLGYQHG